MTDVSPFDDVIDLRDVIERFEELEGERDSYVIGAPDGSETPNPEGWAEEYPDDALDFERFTSLLDELKGYGGDEQWRGDWYPITLIADHHFETYAEELAEDLCGDAMRESSWPLNCIDWEEAAKQLKVDYSTVEFDGKTFWYR